MTIVPEHTLRMALIHNHLEFLRTHRGRVDKDRGLWRCVSDKADFCFSILTDDERPTRHFEQEGTLCVPSWLADPVPPGVSAGRDISHSLSYMLRDDVGSLDKTTAIICRATDFAAIEDFSEAQGRGFCSDEAEYAEWGFWMRDANLRNLANPRQDFFVDYDRRSPAACALSVYDSSIAGIYAVATVPRYRRQGRATALLTHAAAAAKERGYSLLGLQTVTGSAAERLYEGQGFHTSFKMRIFVRS